MGGKDQSPTAPPHVRKNRWETVRAADGLICLIELLGKPREIGGMAEGQTLTELRREIRSNLREWNACPRSPSVAQRDEQ